MNNLKIRRKRSLATKSLVYAGGATALLFTAALPLPVVAQTVSGQTSTEEQEVTALESVTVTVRRRQEEGQRVPTSMSSVRGDDLADKRITQVQDLQQVLPSTNAAFVHSRQSAVAVRGIGSTPASEGLDGTVGLYVDNVFYARPGMLAIDLVDLEQVDLLRGPQGTLFGKNTTGGVLSLTTKKPTFTPESSIALSAGNRGYYQTLASFSGPLSETLAARLSLSKTHDDGWVKNTYNGKTYGKFDREGIRTQFLWKPDANFDLRLSADFNHEDGNQGTGVPYGFGPAALGTLTWQAATIANGGQPLPTNPKKYKANFDGLQQANTHQGGVSAEANWHLANGFDVTSITAWRKWDFRPKNDGDFSSVSFSHSSGVNARHKQFSQELRLASPRSESFDYVVGAYYYWQEISNESFTEPGTRPNAPARSRDLGESKTHSFSLFGQSNWHLTPRLDLTTGLRGTYETKEGRIYRAEGTPATVGFNTGNLSVHDFSPSALASLSYRFTDRFLGYTLLSYGEKSGSVNIGGIAQALSPLGPDSLKIDPESATNFEVGFKSEWFDRRLQVNSNLFLGKIKDYQTSSWADNGAGGSTSVLSNAGNVKTYGLEFDIKARPVRRLSLTLNGSYNHARYTEFDNATCSAEAKAAGAIDGFCNLKGKRLVGAPEWIVNVGGRYDWFVGESVNQYFVANYAWRSESEGNIDTSRYARIPAYGLLNLATGWQFGAGARSWDVSIWARNALDKRYFMQAGFGSRLGTGGYIASTGAPRTIGVTVKLDF
ncbi:MAG: TonB-dependent receptor [Zoogloeaceae bacterium]|jgi:iron complex outermembrane receptor protein|nr:TonB-dependent receptor [Zoogloeaceae bacterium]